MDNYGISLAVFIIFKANRGNKYNEGSKLVNSWKIGKIMKTKTWMHRVAVKC